MSQTVPYLRVFISSPGDVTVERKIVMDVIENLPNRPAFRDKVAFRVIAWDKPGAGTAMRASMSPQEAINAKLPLPSECDIVITLFWSRMGTPFELDGEKFLSGTHWELLDALNANRPITLLYRRTEIPNIQLNDPKRANKLEQFDTLEAFFKSDLFYDPATGAIRRGYNSYPTPDDFRRDFETHFEECVLEILENLAEQHHHEVQELSPSPNIETITTKQWEGSPFPGLRAFTEADAPIFFGRGRETDELVKKVASSRFVAVVGASGSGKSSLVAAGLIPQLRSGAIIDDGVNSADWKIVRLTPGHGDSPFDALFDGLTAIFPTIKPNPLEERRVRLNFVSDMTEAPATLVDVCESALNDAPDWAEVVLFIDQFEELFTLVDSKYRNAFVRMLIAISKSQNVRAIITMRSDFYHRCVDIPELADLLQAGSFPLSIPGLGALYQMITRPAEVAALTFENGLPDQILTDTGDEPGSLALMAYTLDELYRIATQRGDNHLTFADYDALGYTTEDGVHISGVQGAIGKRAELEFAKLDTTVQEQLGRIFHRLVEVDERGTAARRRTPIQLFENDAAAQSLITSFIEARLLTADNNMIEVAHEALLRHWPRLAEWIDTRQDDLRLLSQVQQAAREWYTNNLSDAFLWPDERLKPVHKMIERLEFDRTRDLSEIEREFIHREFDRLLEELEYINTTHKRRSWIGERLDALGDKRPGVGLGPSGLPDIAWCKVGDGTPTTIDGVEHYYGYTQEVDTPFYIAKYPITHRQFQAFIDAEDGYKHTIWWSGHDYQPKSAPKEQFYKFWNHPRDSVNWFEAIAFCRWLSYRLTGQLPDKKNRDSWPVRLPTIEEWKTAATGGNSKYIFPWGEEWDERLANTSDSGLSRTTAVGMYPHGAAPCGLLDMSGGVYEWTLSYHRRGIHNIDGYDSPIDLRGGSWSYSWYNAQVSNGYGSLPEYSSPKIGFRVMSPVQI